jgi:Rrf2 family protein
MRISQKCQYALRALFDLARQEGRGPRKIGDVAEAQGIPPRFLEVILNQLKQAGFVTSRRGAEGGYQLARPARLLTVGEVVRFVEGPLHPLAGRRDGARPAAPGGEDPRVFQTLWGEVERSLAAVLDGRTFHDLVEEDRRGQTAVDYVI